MRARRESPCRPQPRAYRGVGHETIGSDIIAVARTLSLPSLSLGADLFTEILTVEPNLWYPIDLLLRAMDRLAMTMTDHQLRHLGRLIYRQSHAGAPLPKTLGELAHGFDAMYHTANRGEGIGGWTVLTLTDREAVLEKSTPGVCVIEEGIAAEVLDAMTFPARISQSQCVRKGHDRCLFHIHVSDRAL